jgi:energy-coupling factor transporter ATP-binding protein EcfA2
MQKKHLQRIGKNFDEMTFEQLKILWGRVAGKDYVYNDYNKPILNKLMAYFINDDRVLDYDDLNPFKGIMLIGKKGCGKTTILNNFSKMFDELKKYCDSNRENQIFNRVILSVSIEKLKSYYLLNNNIEKYSYNVIGDTTYSRPYEIIINEFGITYDTKIFGTTFQEIINSLLMSRYELFIERGVLTHVTTNLDTEELKKIFDPMLVDRFKEMFNIIELKGESFRK